MLGQGAGGIHWHMNITNKMTYIATDEQRQVIPWVRMEDNKGNIVDFTTKDNPPTQAQIDAGCEAQNGLHRLPQSSVACVHASGYFGRPEHGRR